jgi:hypothetical protein
MIIMGFCVAHMAYLVLHPTRHWNLMLVPHKNRPASLVYVIDVDSSVASSQSSAFQLTAN